MIDIFAKDLQIYVKNVSNMQTQLDLPSELLLIEWAKCIPGNSKAFYLSDSF